MENDCRFCSFSEDPNIKVWENDFFFAMHDSFPVSVGHSLIIPKRHVLNIYDLSQGEWSNLFDANNIVVRIIESSNFKEIYTKMLINNNSPKSIEFLKDALSKAWITTKPNAYNFGINDGKEAGRTIDHLHWHIIPRYKGDMEDPTGGVRHVIPEKGNYKK